MQFEFIWVVQFILLPVIGAIFVLIFRHGADDAKVRSEIEKMMADHRRALDMQILALQADLTAFRLSVADKYASNGYIKDVENRVVAELKALSSKLDKLNDWIVNNK